MTIIDDTAELRASLADQLAEILDSPLWQNAFRAVPRHVFAPRFAIHDPVTRTLVHHDVTDAERRDAALAAAYSDDTLLTRFSEDGTAISSSTEPSLMASMLQALDAQPGHRVLEVGTGTGYNAALLCHALGEGNVTTIDVDRHLTDTAADALAEAGYRPTVVCGDGAAGVAERAPFDRIIATCGVDRVPAAWLTQLAPHGAILVNISKGIVLLRRHHDGSVSGPFLSPAGFMPLRADTDPDRLAPRAIVEATSNEADSTHTTSELPELPFAMGAFFANLIADRSQLLFLHGHDDTVSSYRWVHPQSNSWARVDLADDHATVHQAGPRQLWNDMTPVLESWQAAGRPGIERYGLTVTDNGQHTLWLDQPGQSVMPLPA